MEDVEYNPAHSGLAGIGFEQALVFQADDIPDIVGDEQWTDAGQYKNKGEYNS